MPGLASGLRAGIKRGSRRSFVARVAVKKLGETAGCNYCYYMKRVELKVARIGNSRGVRLPAGTLARYRIGDTVLMEERSDGILLLPRGHLSAKLSWEDTAREMARAGEDWSEWDATLTDGLESVPWQAPKAKRVAKPRAGYASKRRRR